MTRTSSWQLAAADARSQGSLSAARNLTGKKLPFRTSAPQSSDKIPPSIQSLNDFRNLAFFNKKLEEAFDARRWRLIKGPGHHGMVVDMVDPTLNDQIFDAQLGITF